MKKQIEELSNLGLDLDKFYCVTLFYGIQLQGYASNSLMNDLGKLGYEFDYDKENNWFQSIKENVKITLTLNN
jgi:hypothetical protein